MARNARKWNGRWLSALCVVACPLVVLIGCDMLMFTRSSHVYMYVCTLSSYHPLTYRNVKPKRSVRISRLALAGAAAGTLRVAWRHAAAVVHRN